MYICICHAVSRDDIFDELKRSPQKNLRQVLDEFEVSHDCGTCEEVVEELKKEVIQKKLRSYHER